MNAKVQYKSSRIPLRSKLLAWLENNPLKVASAKQWQGTINNLQSVRKEEKERSGIVDYLALQNELGERVFIEQIIDHIEKHLQTCQPKILSFWKHAFSPSLEVKNMAEQLPARMEKKAKRFVEKAQACYQHPSMGYWIIRTGYEDLATIAPNWIVLDQKGKLLLSHDRHGGWFPSAMEAFDEMHRTIRKRFDEFGTDHPDTLFAQYALMGGKNYQEWFICLPNWPLPYCDNHFKMKQLLVHIRTTERVDQDGQSIFMVEEIQSPWHADIRKSSSIADAPFPKEWHELAIKVVMWLAIQQGFMRIGFTTGKQQCERWWDMEGLINLYDQLIPKCLMKIESQFECVNDWLNIDTRKPSGKINYIREGEWEVLDVNKTPISPPVKNKDVALFILNSRSTPVKEQIRVLQLSEKFKQEIMSGEISLFGW